ncbi:MAG: nitrobenzoate reductase [Rhodospirillales bacterium]|nr:nitrobenzoate reductase [Rhodospirillales bacterium]
MQQENLKPADAPLSAITSRRSVRAFLDRPVPRGTIEEILRAASRAPSANNTQPWRVYVLTGAARDRLSGAILADRASGADEPKPEYAYYPPAWPEPYLSRRRKIGWDLYGLLGIAKGDRAAGRAWHDLNFSFFGAPVGMIFTLDRDLAIASYIDLGMFLQNIATAARSLGLDTCPQAAFASYHAIIRTELGLDPNQVVVCGMSLGHADETALPNQLTTEREPPASFAHFLDA